MSGTPTSDEIKIAVSAYLMNHMGEGIQCDYDSTTGNHLLKDTKGAEVIIGPDLKCTIDGQPAQAIENELREIIMDLKEPEPAPPQKAVQKYEERPKTGTNFDIQDWRAKQDRTYSVSGKNAPNAFAASEEANRRSLSTQIIDSGRTKDLVWGHVRITDPRNGQYREDRVSHEREVFCLLKAWEDANAQARKNPGLIEGVIPETHMPLLDPKARIKGMPADLWLTMSIMRAWSFADRDAITKAERRAQLKILNREWREDEEISLEQEEERAVQGAR